MMMKYLFPAIAAFLLVACTDTQSPAPTRKTQKVKISVARSLDMESLCKNEAVRRYNTGMQKIDTSGLEQFQGSYETRSSTFRKESFACSFDVNGQSSHLSIR